MGATVDGLENVGATVEGRDEPLDVGDEGITVGDADVDVVGEMVFGPESGAVGVGCVMMTGGGVTICVPVC
jgi:hypothetical protein